MTKNNHGGPRPKISDTDKRGRHHSPKPGSGRKPTTFTLKLDDKFYKSQQDDNGNGILPGELWTVTKIERTHVIFTSDNGDTYRLRR